LTKDKKQRSESWKRAADMMNSKAEDLDEKTLFQIRNIILSNQKKCNNQLQFGSTEVQSESPKGFD
jgi:hypothetical protein